MKNYPSSVYFINLAHSFRYIYFFFLVRIRNISEGIFYVLKLERQIEQYKVNVTFMRKTVKDFIACTFWDINKNKSNACHHIM